MTDLVDYLRDKLDHADDAVCSCPDIDVSSAEDQATLPRHKWPTVKGYDRRCPIHGPAGPQPSDYVVYSNQVENWADVELRPVPKKRWWRRG